MRAVTRARLRAEAKRIGTAQARRRINRLKDTHPYLTEKELESIEADLQLSYIAGFTRGLAHRNDY